MDDDESLERKVRKLAVEHAETRWLALRLDDDIQELRKELRAVRRTQENHSETLLGHTGILLEHSVTLRQHSEMLQQHSETLQQHTEILQAHTGRFDSIDLQLRSLTQLVGQVAERLGEAPGKE